MPESSPVGRWEVGSVGGCERCRVVGLDEEVEEEGVLRREEVRRWRWVVPVGVF